MRALLAAIVVFATISGAAPVGADAAAAAEPPAYVAPPIDWRPCHPEAGPGFECGVLLVPVDYDHPAGPKVRVAVARLRAHDSATSLGSILLNPGGPGGSGVDFLLGAGPFLYGDQLRTAYDLVGFDPRGTNRSTPLRCFDTFEAAILALPPFAFPMTPDEEKIEKAATEYLAENCGHTRPIRDHMSTANVARDMDALRAALGDDYLHYAGYSYGSYLGAVYANLFPDRVGRLLVDGVLDPEAWLGDPGDSEPFSYRLRSDVGAQATLDEFFRLCDAAGPSGCAFAPNASDRFDALAELLLADGPIEVVDPFSGEVFPFRYSDLIGSTLGPLYNSAAWPFHAQFLAFLEAEASAAVLGEALGATFEAAGISTLSHDPRFPNFVEAFPGVACSDSNNPDVYEAWPFFGAKADANYGYFGRIWTHASVPCWNWPGADADRYEGSFTAATANPVLIVNPAYDPATPISGALALDALLPNAAMLTVNGWGHTSLFMSFCADLVVIDYFLTGATPADGATCAQDLIPFAAPPGPAAADAQTDTELTERAEQRADVMREVALRPGR